jgi:hypothetical protein
MHHRGYYWLFAGGTGILRGSSAKENAIATTFPLPAHARILLILQ